jgi:hypothetical protein
MPFKIEMLKDSARDVDRRLTLDDAEKPLASLRGAPKCTKTGPLVKNWFLFPGASAYREACSASWNALTRPRLPQVPKGPAFGAFM